MNKVTQADINKQFGTIQAAKQPLILNGQPIYRFDFETISVDVLKTQKGMWQLEVKQRQGWELLSVAVSAPTGGWYLLTWRRPQ